MGSPRFGEPARVAFVGQEATFGQCALHVPVGGLVPRFFDVRPGVDAAELAAALEAWGAHVAIFLGADGPPPEPLAALPALTVAFVAETIERGADGADPSPAARAAPLAGLGGSGWDRIVTFDPLLAADGIDVWRSSPLPVDDRLYSAVRPSALPPRILFVGSSTERRERFIVAAKHAYDLLHYAHGLHGQQLHEVLAATDVGLNVHRDWYPTFEHRALVHLAAGHLLISEPLAPTHGLEPEADFLEIRRPDELMTTLYQLQRRPDAFERVRLRGRAKADDYRASRVWPRLIGDLFADVAAFGTQRTARSATTSS